MVVKEHMTIEELKSVIGFSILHTGKLMIKKINNHFTEVGADITAEQMKVLFFISVNQERTVIQQDVAEIMDKSKSAVLRTIDILEKKNFVTRKPFANDRRKHMLLTTEEGEKVARKALQIFKDQSNVLIKDLDPSDIQVCMKVLNAIQLECASTDPCRE